MLGLAFEMKACLVQAALFRDMFSNKGSPLAVLFIPEGILLVKKLFHKNSFYSCDDIFIPFEPYIYPKKCSSHMEFYLYISNIKILCWTTVHSEHRNEKVEKFLFIFQHNACTLYYEFFWSPIVLRRLNYAPFKLTTCCKINHFFVNWFARNTLTSNTNCSSKLNLTEILTCNPHSHVQSLHHCHAFAPQMTALTILLNSKHFSKPSTP